VAGPLFVDGAFWGLRKLLVRRVGHISELMLAVLVANMACGLYLLSSIKTVSIVLSRVQLARQGSLVGSTCKASVY